MIAFSISSRVKRLLQQWDPRVVDKRNDKVLARFQNLGARAVTALIAELEDVQNTPEMRGYAAFFLARSGAFQAIVKRLLQQWDPNCERERHAQIESFFQVLGDQAVPALVAELEDVQNTPEMREYAASFLVRADALQTTVKSLLQQWRRYCDRELEEKIESCFQILGGQAVPALIAELEDVQNTPEMRGFVASVLAKVGAVQAIPSLNDALGEANHQWQFELRRATAEALGTLFASKEEGASLNQHAQGIAENLVAMLRIPDNTGVGQEVAAHALVSLGSIGADALKEGLADVDIQHWCVLVLEKTGAPIKDVADLLSAIWHGQPHNRTPALLRLLIKATPQQAAQLLKECISFATSPDALVEPKDYTYSKDVIPHPVQRFSGRIGMLYLPFAVGSEAAAIVALNADSKELHSSLQTYVSSLLERFLNLLRKQILDDKPSRQEIITPYIARSMFPRDWVIAPLEELRSLAEQRNMFAVECKIDATLAVLSDQPLKYLSRILRHINIPFEPGSLGGGLGEVFEFMGATAVGSAYGMACESIQELGPIILPALSQATQDHRVQELVRNIEGIDVLRE